MLVSIVRRLRSFDVLATDISHGKSRSPILNHRYFNNFQFRPCPCSSLFTFICIQTVQIFESDFVSGRKDGD